ncbi:hypothetical protein ACFZB9_32670 [Kitasatospora sp. NPDC008050]|uniref:hypothetical protein n=1 Tax=Kitasatospora sp. NPDC008050 TaxID=3364021 RepID=UPI0036EBA1C3
MTVKRPSSPKRVPRTPQEAARRHHLLDASSGELGYGGVISTPQLPRSGNHGLTGAPAAGVDHVGEVS